MFNWCTYEVFLQNWQYIEIMLKLNPDTHSFLCSLI